ncbi:YrrS family protein [Heyndrickxia camelliae]|uniref:DNA primase n=1 Tax=Heyndrickxia camelliae TaxID=1707093 RepID=A0A2N3LKM4_9BACI|nr:YrrS family protein [Heyndrickxia camelliae]PKR85166.1 DNA primase [Heyndrickxia camelliae]
MANDYNHPNRSRSLQRAKRRKTNIILNSLIVIVILLIIIVASFIFLGGGKDDNKSSAPANTAHKQETSIDSNKSKSESNGDKNGSSDGTVSDNNDNTGDSSDDSSADKDSDNSQLDDSNVVANEGNDPNVKKTYVNPSWKPVGTSQTGGHQYSSDFNSTDWKEKEKALSYATGIPSDQMTIWYMSRVGSDSSVIGTITSKKDKKAYRVYLEWIDGQGWKPSKVEELNHNDRQ